MGQRDTQLTIQLFAFSGVFVTFIGQRMHLGPGEIARISNESLFKPVTILQRYSRSLQLYGLSWELLASATIFDWCRISRRNIEAAILSWLTQESRRLNMPSILRSSQVTSLRLSSTFSTAASLLARGQIRMYCSKFPF